MQPGCKPECEPRMGIEEWPESPLSSAPWPLPSHAQIVNYDAHKITQEMRNKVGAVCACVSAANVHLTCVGGFGSCPFERPALLHLGPCALASHVLLWPACPGGPPAVPEGQLF